jgi:hypothetical protein
MSIISSVIVLNNNTECHSSTCYSTACHSAECHTSQFSSVDCHVAMCHSEIIVLLNIILLYFILQCHAAKCHSDYIIWLSVIQLTVILLSSFNRLSFCSVQSTDCHSENSNAGKCHFA